jgi:phage recombination protein Bet
MSTDALQIREPKDWLASQGHSQAELGILRRFICADFKGEQPSDGELMFFVLYCRQHNLDPFSKQAHLLKTKSGPQVCLGIDGMRIRAAQSGEYGGQDEPAFELDAKGAVLACRIVIYRLVQGQRVPFPAISWMNESKGNTPIWSQRPRGMLEKCAEAKALRKAFPERCGGFYTPEEMIDQGDGPRRQTATATDLNARLKAKPPEPPTIDAEALPEPPADPVTAMLAAFSRLSVSTADVLEFCGVDAIDKIAEKELASLRGWYAELSRQPS